VRRPEVALRVPPEPEQRPLRGARAVEAGAKAARAQARARPRPAARPSRWCPLIRLTVRTAAAAVASRVRRMAAMALGLRSRSSRCCSRSSGVAGALERGFYRRFGRRITRSRPLFPPPA
jgi:hypothetical protein